MDAHRPDATELVLVADTALDRDLLSAIRARAAKGAHVVAWQHRSIVQDRFPSPDVSSWLEEQGIAHESLSFWLGEGGDDAADDAVIAWMKELGRRPLGGGASFRKRFRHGPLVLWWWAELYLYHETPLRLLVRDVEALARLADRLRPARITVVAPRRCLAAAARRFARDVEVLGEPVAEPPLARRTNLLHAADLLKMLGSGVKSLLRRSPSTRNRTGAEDSSGVRVFFLTHASMWRERRRGATDEPEPYEIYFDRLLPAAAERPGTSVSVVAFGPPVPFKRRRLLGLARDLLEIDDERLPYRPVRRYFTLALALRLAATFGECRRLWREFRGIPDLDESLTHRGVSLLPQALASFRDTFWRQLPWAIRSFEEVRAALEGARADVLVLYAESSGLGRAAVAACRETGVASFAVQHGIMYPRYYSHEHAPHELEGEASGEAVPIPTRTAVFGRLAKSLLVERGSYPESRIHVTGSPKFDALVETAKGYDRAAVRRSLGLSGGDRFLVLASRYSAVGATVLEQLVRAVEKREKLWLFLKPHQAESERPYRELLERTSPPPSRCRLLPAKANLLELLFASDGLVTVDSLASSEALILGRPVLVVNLPSNLGPLVERGVALGVRGGDSVEEAIEELLFDEEAARRLAARRAAYIQEFAYGADGRSTERIVDAILETARTPARTRRERKA